MDNDLSLNNYINFECQVFIIFPNVNLYFYHAFSLYTYIMTMMANLKNLKINFYLKTN